MARNPVGNGELEPQRNKMDIKRLDLVIQELRDIIMGYYENPHDIEKALVAEALDLAIKVKEGKLVENSGGQVLFNDLAHRLIGRILEFNPNEHDLELNLCGIIEKAKLSTPRLMEEVMVGCIHCGKSTPTLMPKINKPSLMEECLVCKGEGILKATTYPINQGYIPCPKCTGKKPSEKSTTEGLGR